VSITILFVLAPIGAIVAWWLSQQRLTAKPWLEVGAIDDTGASSLPAATIGLGVFLAVVSSLFALFISAYFMRMQVEMPGPLPVRADLGRDHLGVDHRAGPCSGRDCFGRLVATRPGGCLPRFDLVRQIIRHHADCSRTPVETAEKYNWSEPLIPDLTCL
jgi:hypothetical protein